MFSLQLTDSKKNGGMSDRRQESKISSKKKPPGFNRSVQDLDKYVSSLHYEISKTSSSKNIEKNVGSFSNFLLSSVGHFQGLNVRSLNNTEVQARPLDAPHASRDIALVWRTNSPRHSEFELLAETMRQLYPG